MKLGDLETVTGSEHHGSIVYGDGVCMVQYQNLEGRHVCDVLQRAQRQEALTLCALQFEVLERASREKRPQRLFGFHVRKVVPSVEGNIRDRVPGVTDTPVHKVGLDVGAWRRDIELAPETRYPFNGILPRLGHGEHQSVLMD